ncbi:MAG: hypothetical protein COB66_01355 [Coxiella sp. (in: Bacteria)]|nr:MAG: hypothetical protein COB66_01355 [Coxiella sp. (in: g-proteobacteria)]
MIAKPKQQPKTSSKLAQHIAAMRDAKAEGISLSTGRRQVLAEDSILFWGTAADKNYLPYLKGCVGSYTVRLRLDKLETVAQLKMYCAGRKINKVISTSVDLLKKLLYWDKRKAPSLSNYAGSYFKIPSMNSSAGPDIEIVFISPLKQLVTVPSGKFMATRLIKKLTHKDEWFVPSAFNWEELTPEKEEASFNFIQKHSFMVCIDIETFRENAAIRCLSYTGFYYMPGSSILQSMSYVLPMDSEYNLAIMKKWNWELKAPKVFQNGKYDIAYLARYNAPVYNYLFDTAHWFHSWYSELPKDLGFLNSFFIREAVYWKDLAETNDLHEYYRYNALDTWGTGNAFLAMLIEAPEYARTNYLLEFPLVFPCHLSEMTGIERDMDTLKAAKAEQDAIIDKATFSLNTILSVPAGESFNVNSPKQMMQLLALLGCKDLKNADAKALAKARFRHPLNAKILSLVLTIRKARKLVSTYLTPGKEFRRQDGTGSRILFALNPHGTDTSRLASREHHFWCGLQVQNIPRGPAVKRTLKADPGFFLAEADLSQAESRDTAYISGDPTLIEAVEHSPDFHSYNASKFFGVPFEEIYDALKQEVINKPLRQLGKPVNHGANYNMGAYVLIDTMGEEKVQEAKILLGLNRFWTYMQVAEYLLEQFHKTYPGIRGTMYEGVKNEIAMTGMLKSQAVHYCTSKEDWDLQAEGSWTRRCFGNPSASKQSLNSYIAHPPQSLNAQTLNKAYLATYHNIAMNPKHTANFKLNAQIHDSILFQFREDHEYLCKMVEDLLEIPVTIKAYDGVVRTFTVPAETKCGPADNPSIYWSEC